MGGMRPVSLVNFPSLLGRDANVDAPRAAPRIERDFHFETIDFTAIGGAPAPAAIVHGRLEILGRERGFAVGMEAAIVGKPGRQGTRRNGRERRARCGAGRERQYRYDEEQEGTEAKESRGHVGRGYFSFLS